MDKREEVSVSRSVCERLTELLYQYTRWLTSLMSETSFSKQSSMCVYVHVCAHEDLDLSLLFIYYD